MKSIWKYPLLIQDSQVIMMPQDAVVLCVQVQNSIPCIWAEVNTEKMPAPRTFSIFGTGHKMLEDLDFGCIVSRKYIGTFQINYGTLIFHCYEEIE